MINSIIDASFTCKIKKMIKVEHYEAIVPKVTDPAYITGKHKCIMNPDASLNKGFILR